MYLEAAGTGEDAGSRALRREDATRNDPAGLGGTSAGSRDDPRAEGGYGFGHGDIGVIGVS